MDNPCDGDGARLTGKRPAPPTDKFDAKHKRLRTGPLPEPLHFNFPGNLPFPGDYASPDSNGGIFSANGLVGSSSGAAQWASSPCDNLDLLPFEPEMSAPYFGSRLVAPGDGLWNSTSESLPAVPTTLAPLSFFGAHPASDNPSGSGEWSLLTELPCNQILDETASSWADFGSHDVTMPAQQSISPFDDGLGVASAFTALTPWEDWGAENAVLPDVSETDGGVKERWMEEGLVDQTAEPTPSSSFLGLFSEHAVDSKSEIVASSPAVSPQDDQADSAQRDTLPAANTNVDGSPTKIQYDVCFGVVCSGQGLLLESGSR